MSGYQLPPDIKKPWLSPIRRLQGAAGGQRGLAILTISILVDENGNPVCWTDPKRTLIEPRQRAADILNTLLNGAEQ